MIMEVLLRQATGIRAHTLCAIAMICMLGASPRLFAAPHQVPGAADLSAWRLPPGSNAKDTPMVNLGRQLFFDPRLTGSDAISCAQCHLPGLEYSDGRPRPMPQQLTLGRNTIALINVGYRKTFFWDGRADSLIAAITDHLADSGSLASQHPGHAIAANVSALGVYRHAFSLAFHVQKITVLEISQALAAYLQTLRETDTPFDRWIHGDAHALSDEAKRGFAIFTAKGSCVRCHAPPYFSDFRFHNIGINSIDPGRYEVTGKADDRGAFRTPDLRQVARTGPYMHNGSLASLADVINFYNKGGDSLDPSNELKPIGLSADDQHALLMFLYSLTNEHPHTEPFPVLPAVDQTSP
jgi:cytochrome c peroxidase